MQEQINNLMELYTYFEFFSWQFKDTRDKENGKASQIRVGIRSGIDRKRLLGSFLSHGRGSHPTQLDTPR